MRALLLAAYLCVAARSGGLHPSNKTVSARPRSNRTASVTCSSGLRGDDEKTGCAAFCQVDKAANHCRFCKCRNCGYCTPVLHANREAKNHATPCKSELAGDFPYRA